VLDGAAGAQQVRPLLPGGAGCALIVTCRRPMSTLDAVRLRLDRLPDTDGIALVAALAGAERTAADPAAAARLVALCDGHPLALRIAGARLAERTDWPLAALADRLGDERERLDALAADDLAIRSSFRDGYNELADSALGELIGLEKAELIPEVDVQTRLIPPREVPEINVGAAFDTSNVTGGLEGQIAAQERVVADAQRADETFGYTGMVIGIAEDGTWRYYSPTD